jgi:hypothetical protein
MNATTNTAAAKAIPTTVYAQGDKLFVHAGGEFRVIAAMGAIGKVAVASNYPASFGVKTDTRWTHDTAGMASYAAQAINAYPVLKARVSVLEQRQADLVAKLKIAQVALQRKETLGDKYIASLVAEIERSLNAAQAK